ncbi:MAG: arylesterase [Desulfuromonadales bacterium]
MPLVRLYLFLLVLTIGHVQSLHANNTTESTLRLLVLGDSLSAGYGLQPTDSFPAQLEEALHDAGYGVRVINAGVSGDTTAGGLSRLDWALSDQPHIVLVELGGNDALRGLPPTETYNNLDAILARLENHAISVILAGMQAPRNLGEDYTTAFDAIYPRLADKYALPFYPFFLEGVALDPALNQADGIHPNAAGVSEIVRRILPLLQAELDKINPRR